MTGYIFIRAEHGGATIKALARGVAAEAWVAALCAGMLTGLKPLSMTEDFKNSVQGLWHIEKRILSDWGKILFKYSVFKF